MVINTKYNINDEVFYLKWDRIHKSKIKLINIRIIPNEESPLVTIKYKVADSIELDEDLCFSTKEEVIDKLLKDSDK